MELNEAIKQVVTDWYSRWHRGADEDDDPFEDYPEIEVLIRHIEQTEGMAFEIMGGGWYKM